MKVEAYIGLGSNLNDPLKQLTQASHALAELPNTVLIKTSRIYQTAPVGFCDQADFLNAVSQIQTSLSPEILLDHLLAIEQAQLRLRKEGEKNGPRTLDLDILLYGQEVISKNGLIVPHPRMTERAFVIMPLLEVAPYLVLPDGRAIAEIAKEDFLKQQRVRVV